MQHERNFPQWRKQYCMRQTVCWQPRALSGHLSLSRDSHTAVDARPHTSIHIYIYSAPAWIREFIAVPRKHHARTRYTVPVTHRDARHSHIALLRFVNERTWAKRDAKAAHAIFFFLCRRARALPFFRALSASFLPTRRTRVALLLSVDASISAAHASAAVSAVITRMAC